MMQKFKNIMLSLNPNKKHFIEKYFNFINNRKKFKKVVNDGLEKHHILPKSYHSDFEKCNENIAILTTREHFIAHKMLANIYGDKMWYALFYMINSIPKYRKNMIHISSKEYEKIRQKASNDFSDMATNRRANESEQEKKLRVAKWKINREGKSDEQKRQARLKQADTIRKNGGIKHKVCCLMCKKVFKIISRFEQHTCIFNKPRMIRKKKPKEIIIKKQKHKEQQVINIKIKKEKPILSCIYCEKVFTFESVLNKHTERCKIPVEVRKRDAILKRQESIKNRSAEKQKELSNKLSLSLSNYNKNITEEKAILRSQKCREKSLQYYESEKYDKELRSKQIKNGFKNENN